MKTQIKMIALLFLVCSGRIVFAEGENRNFIPNEFVAKLNSRIGDKVIEKFKLKLPKHLNLSSIDDKKTIFKINSSKNLSLGEIRQQLAGLSIKYIEPNYIYHLQSDLSPNDPDFKLQWGLSHLDSSPEAIDIQAKEAWTMTTGHTDVIVAVVDTGVDYNHPDLYENMWINQKERDGLAHIDDDGNGVVDDIYGYDFANNDSDPFDDMYHGTHCAGIIGARGNNSMGITGVNWQVKMMAIKIFKPNQGGSLDNTLRALSYAAKNGARIINASWGGGAQSKIFEELLKELEKDGVLFIAAAGNSNVNTDINPQFPAAYKLPNVISVGAMDSMGNFAEFSNYGQRSVHLAAPGVQIYSTLPNAKYGFLSGTSMAAPFVTGVAALLYSQNSALTSADVRNRLLKKGKRLNLLKNKVSSRSMLNAWGAMANLNPISDFDPDDPELWKKNQFLIKSPSPYDANSKLTYEVKIENAKRIALHFNFLDSEEGFDLLRIFDKQGHLVGVMSGQLDDAYSPIILGDYARIEFTSDQNNNGLGFEIESVRFE